MSWYRNLSLAKKLYGGFGIVLTLLAVTVLVSDLGTSSLHSSAHSLAATELTQTGAAANVRAAALDMHFSQAEYVANGGASRADFLADRATFEQALARMKALVRSSDERKDTAALVAAYGRFDATDAEVSAAISHGNRAAAQSLLLGAGNDAADAIAAAAKALQAGDSREAADDMASFDSTVASTRWATFGSRSPRWHWESASPSA